MTAGEAVAKLREALVIVQATREAAYLMKLDCVRGANGAWWRLSEAEDAILAAVHALGPPKEDG